MKMIKAHATLRVASAGAASLRLAQCHCTFGLQKDHCSILWFRRENPRRLKTPSARKISPIEKPLHQIVILLSTRMTKIGMLQL
jgi:hypothetical protein